MEGDVSLTIINVTENDSGIYGCRVEIPGPFNDLKQKFNLIIRKAHQTKIQSKSAETATDNPTAGRTTSARSTASSLQTTARHREGLIGSTGYSTQTRVQSRKEEDSGYPLLIIIPGTLLVVLILVALLIFMMRLRMQNKVLMMKNRPNENIDSDLQPPAREMAVENIYQLDN
ncbi:hypothetical protein AAFF_G00320090 [Aldrovandia affinis]|uniref:Ig-like domain-containing protein n=1 Tax=Aldrovandia affinis TaxID=143900 RepID=A0AAD7WQC7_9TELE|nr:hypothetical protein AAFF_G00320090 [Aldrovandia affinis]